MRQWDIMNFGMCQVRTKPISNQELRAIQVLHSDYSRTNLSYFYWDKLCKNKVQQRDLLGKWDVPQSSIMPKCKGSLSSKHYKVDQLVHTEGGRAVDPIHLLTAQPPNPFYCL